MKPLRTIAVALVGLVLASVGISLSGQRLAAEQEKVAQATAATMDAKTEDLALQAAEPDVTGGVPEAEAGDDMAENAAPGLERAAPRAPLSELAAAQPPKPKKQPKPDEWKATRLFNPVATAAGILEAQGYRVAVAGVEPTPVEESCSYEGRDWPCGARARTAFRSWLRARAVQCVVPPAPDRELITAECNIGKEDIAAWLVASGWARAATSGQYADLGDKAKTARKGLFGPPPARVNVTAPVQPAPLDLPTVEPAPADTLEPPAQLPSSSEAFPPPPPAPAQPAP